jgi:hypothetical protein
VAQFYIHVDDPSFPDAPWPGVRRLGPYLTLEEAQAQATSDAAFSGLTGEIYDEDASAALDQHLQAAAALDNWEATTAALVESGMKRADAENAAGNKPRPKAAPKARWTRAQVKAAGTKLAQQAQADAEEAAQVWLEQLQAMTPGAK